MFHPEALLHGRASLVLALSVGWDGTLYDCDFNQMLDLPIGYGQPRHIRDFDLHQLHSRRIVTCNHCYGCTAGAGSSCGSSITPD